MAKVYWVNGVSGTWETGSDWNTGSEPGSGDNVSISVAGTYTVTVEDSEVADTLAISNQTASLDLAADLTLSGGLSDAQSCIYIAKGQTLDVTGGNVIFGVNYSSSGASVDGPGTLSTAAGVTTTIDDGNNGDGVYQELTLGGSVTWSNSGTVADTGRIEIGDGSGETATIINNAGGVFQFEGPEAGIVDNTSASGVFSNAGTIDVGSNSGTSTNFSPLLTNTSTGVIDLQSGTLNLQANSTIGGTVTGGGTLEFSGGNSTITAATSGNLLVAGGNLTLAETASITGNVSETSGGVYLSAGGPATETLVHGFADSQGQVALASGRTLSLTGGAATFGMNSSNAGATVDGPGTLSTAAGVTTTIDDGNNGDGVYQELTLGGGVTWSNSGTVADTGQIQIGDGSGETATIINNAGGVFQFESTNGEIYDNTNASGTFSNAGTIEVGVSTSFSPLLTNTSTGVIDLQAGTLNLRANSTIGGTVTGDGTLEFSGGEGTITAATSANLMVTVGAVLTLDEQGTISGNLTTTGGTVLLEKNVGLSGVVLDQGGVIDLDGNKLTGAAVTLGSSGVLEGHGTVAAPIVNAGTVTAEKGLLELGNGASGSGAFDLSGASKLEFLGSATGVNISFLSGGAETLLLAKPGMVHGTISGFSATDSIDLVKTAATGLSFANGTLTVTGSSGTLAVLNFNGSYVPANFELQSDGKDGTNILYEPVNNGSNAALPDFHPLLSAPEVDGYSHMGVATDPGAGLHALFGAPTDESLTAASLLGHHLQLA